MSEPLRAATMRGKRIHALRPEPNRHFRSLCNLTLLIPMDQDFEPDNPKACLHCARATRLLEDDA